MRFRKRFVLAFSVTASLLWLFNRPSVNAWSLLWLQHKAGYHTPIRALSCPTCRKHFVNSLTVTGHLPVTLGGNGIS